VNLGRWLAQFVMLVSMIMSLTTSASADESTPTPADLCAGTETYLEMLKVHSQNSLVAISLDGKDVIGFGEIQWQSLADSVPSRLLLLRQTEPPPALDSWWSAEAEALEATTAWFQRLADAGGIQIGFDEWPETLAIEPTQAKAESAEEAARLACPDFGDGSRLSSQAEYHLICSKVDDYLADLLTAVENARSRAGLTSERATLDVLGMPPSSLDRPLVEGLWAELSEVSPPAVLIVWHSLLLERFGEEAGVAVESPPGVRPIADFDWYTNMAAYTCEEFALD
jgi:hypothetical protein